MYVCMYVPNVRPSDIYLHLTIHPRQPTSPFKYYLLLPTFLSGREEGKIREKGENGEIGVWIDMTKEGIKELS